VAQQVAAPAVAGMLRAVLPRAALVPAASLLRRLRMRATPWERERIRAACAIAEAAFGSGAQALRAGVPEREAVLPFEAALAVAGMRTAGVERAGGAFFCMSGPHAAQAYAAYQQSRRRPLAAGDTVLIHCNSQADGYWTDITRTYVLGPPSAEVAAMQEAIVHAREAAFDAVRPGVPAHAVDQAARRVLEQAGFGRAFRHPLGHGVGFTPIDHDAWPRIHPLSDDVLEEGMVFNLEPGIYHAGRNGMRDCNMVAVSATGCELLTPFHLSLDEWRLPSRPD
jgi:Xaa-Pro dipeptidase